MKLTITRNTLIKLYISIVILFLLSFLRITLIILLPLLIIAYFIVFKGKHSKYAIVVLPIVVLLSTFISVFNTGEFNTGNFILSTGLLFPVLLLFFSTPNVKDDAENGSYFNYFIKVGTWLLVLSNIIGFIQLFINTYNDDDAFIGLYGRSGLGIHTLSIINFMMCSCYFFKYRNVKSWKNILLCIFFFVSGLMCFYGLGLIVFGITIIIYNLSLKYVFRSVLVSFFILIFVGLSLYFIKPKTFYYNYNNLKMASSYIRGNVDAKYADKIPRKLLIYKNYLSIYFKDPVLFLFGSGPGTFNSRASFLLNGEYSKSKFFEKLFGVYRPKYATVGAYSLWNSKNSNSVYSNGTRNQPFSSIISLLSEYGFVFLMFLSVFVYFKYTTLRDRFNNYFKNHNSIVGKEKMLVMYKYLKFISIFIFLCLFTDNYLEYPEIIVLFLLTYKLIELKLVNI